MYELIELIEEKEFKHGDIIKIVSHDQNCGIEEGVFTAIVVETKNDGLIAILQDFVGWISRAMNNGVCWEISIDWLLLQDVEIYLLESYERFFERNQK